MIQAREPQRATVEEFFFDYADVVIPISNGKSLSEHNVISNEGSLYDIDAVFPDETLRREVRMIATARRLAM